MIKKHRAIFSILFMALTTGAFLGVVKLSASLHFSWDLLFFFELADAFLLCHFLLDIKKMYDFVYRKRYLIGALALAVLVIGKYHGGSIEIWNGLIEPDYPVGDGVIVGKLRAIRSDDWLVSTPHNLSQASETVDFASDNSVMEARDDNLVTLYPNLPSRDISLLSAPNFLGYLFLDTERAFSFAWFLPYFILFFASFEMLMILTKKHRLYSLAGAIMITLSPAVQWWQSAGIAGYGALAVVCFYHFLQNKSWRKKLILSILFGYAGYLYIMCIYPAWLIPFGYVFLIILIWMLIQNKKRLHWRDLLYLVPTLLMIAIPILIILEQNREVLTIIGGTVYPGARVSTGGGPWKLLFTYMANIFYPFKDIANPSEFSQYLSIFPIPIIYSIYLMVKRKKADSFLILSNIVLIGLAIWAIFPLPEIFSKVTLLYMSTGARVQTAIGYLSVILIVYLLAHYEATKKVKKLLNKRLFIAFGLALVSVIVTLKIAGSVLGEYMSWKMVVIILVLFTIIIGLFLYNHRQTNLYLAMLLMAVAALSGAFVHPLNKGLAAFYDKPLAQEVRKLVAEDEDAVFVATDSGITLANYLMVNGAKTLNTTNFVPNLELYRTLDSEAKYEDIYNRYEHVEVVLTEDETTFELVQADYIILYLNSADVCKTGANYLVTQKSDTEYYDSYEEIYGVSNVRIYKTGCAK